MERLWLGAMGLWRTTGLLSANDGIRVSSETVRTEMNPISPSPVSHCTAAGLN
jgi:hypothetical protein